MQEFSAEQMLNEASMLWPVPMSASHISTFIRKMSNGKCKQYEGLSFAEAWELRKRGHVAYWQDRYGLTDVKPKQLQEGKLLARMTWRVLMNEATCKAKLIVRIKQRHRPVLHLSYICNKQNWESELQALLSKQATALRGNLTKINTTSPTGSLLVRGLPVPEIDWDIFKRELILMLDDYAELHGNRPVSNVQLNRLIAICRTNPKAKYNTPKALYTYITKQLGYAD